MYLKRKIDSYLKMWKNSPDRKPLVITGARQIGKTRSIEEFGKNNYKSYIYINFAEEPIYNNIINNSFKPDDIIDELLIINNKLKFIDNETLIFFDEVQDYIDIISSLKFFALDKRYDVICSGSLLGLKYNQVSHIGVGYFNEYLMYPLDFEEFLWANNYKENDINNLVKTAIKLQPISEVKHKVFTNLLFNYIVLGGYPEVVKNFLSDGFSNVIEIQKQLLTNIEYDFYKYTKGLDKAKLNDIFNAIPIFLARENKTFTFNYFKKNSSYFDGVFSWLTKTGIIIKANQLTRFENPLIGFSKLNKFKCYFTDTGLLLAKLNYDKKQLYELGDFHIYKGGVYENLMANILLTQGYKIYYFKNEKSTLEIDFVISTKDSIVPIEVKAASSKAKSLKEVVFNKVKYPYVKYGVKVSANNLSFSNNIISIPHYLAFKLDVILNDNEFIKKIDSLLI